MIGRTSSNSGFFDWIQRITNKSASEGTRHCLRISRDMKNDVIELKKRNDLFQLVQADDSRLKDMGITRNDLEKALALPLHVSAGKWLEHRRSRGRA